MGGNGAAWVGRLGDTPLSLYPGQRQGSCSPSVSASAFHHRQAVPQGCALAEAMARPSLSLAPEQRL